LQKSAAVRFFTDALSKKKKLCANCPLANGKVESFLVERPPEPRGRGDPGEIRAKKRRLKRGQQGEGFEKHLAPYFDSFLEQADRRSSVW
jgi:hypothetical protein